MSRSTVLAPGFRINDRRVVILLPDLPLLPGDLSVVFRRRFRLKDSADPLEFYPEANRTNGVVENEPDGPLIRIHGSSTLIA